MHEPPAPRPYPPESVWRFPQPPVSRLWLLAAITGGLLGVVAAVGGFAFLALTMDRDIPGMIDDERVRKVATRECRLMTSTVEGVPVQGTSPGARLDALTDQNTAVTTMVERIRELSSAVRESDRPLDDWLADWEALVSGREDYVDQRRSGADADFRMPRTSDGDPITQRMNLAAEDVCRVPKVLLRPDLAGTRPI